MGNAVMGEHILRVGIKELTRVRVTCNSCKATTEIDADKLDERFASSRCKYCDEVITPASGGTNALEALRRVLKHLRENDRMTLEFVIPVENH